MASLDLKYIDSHAHLQSEKVSPTLLKEWMNEAQSLGIAHWVLGGVNPQDWNQQVLLNHSHPESFTLSFGLHPWWVATQTASVCEAAFADLEMRFTHGQASVLGELGLDFHERFPHGTHAQQVEFFERQLSLAGKLRLPIVLHIVRAHEPALVLMEDRKVSYRGIVHSFSGDFSTAQRYLRLGLIPSISAAVISRKEGKAFETLRRTVLSLGPNDFVLETDSPDQPPVSEKGQLNRPSNLIQVARWVGEIRGESFESVLNRSSETAQKVFGLKIK
jgi:TatD DNase family protein